MRNLKTKARRTSKITYKQKLDHTRQNDFAAKISHDLRTPLNAIIGLAEIIKDKRAGSVTLKQQEYLGDIIISARHLLQIINDTLRHIVKAQGAKTSVRNTSNKGRISKASLPRKHNTRPTVRSKQKCKGRNYAG